MTWLWFRVKPKSHGISNHDDDLILIILVSAPQALTQWGRVTHICDSKLANTASDNGLSPGWRLAIIWTNAGILLIGP